MAFVHLVAHLQSLCKTINLSLAQAYLIKPVFSLKNIENYGEHMLISSKGGEGQGIDLSTALANAVPQEVILH